MKIHHSDIYNNFNWNCINCNAKENFEHLWRCSHEQNTINSFLKELKEDIYLQSALVSATSSRPLTICKPALTSLHCWSYDPTHLNLLDIIRGYIPQSLVEILVSWELSVSNANSVLIKSLFNFQCKIRTLWFE